MAVSETSYSTFTQSSTGQSNEFESFSKTNNRTLGVNEAASMLTDINTLVWRVVCPVLLTLGSFGNVMTVVVMRGMRSSQSSACLSLYFTALALSDQCELVTAVLFFWVGKGFSWPPSFFEFNLLCSVPTFVYHVCGITSAWFLVAMTYQRVTSVVAPHRVAVVCTAGKGKWIVALVVFVGVALNSHFLFTWVYWPQFRKCEFHHQYAYLVDYFEWQDMLCYSLLPFLFLVVGNSILIRQVIRSRTISRKIRAGTDRQKSLGSDRVQSMSVTLIVTSAAYLVFTLPPCVFSICMKMDYVTVSDEESRAVLELVKSMLTVCWMCATASNFYLYLLSGKKFRQETKRYLCCYKGEDGAQGMVSTHLSR